jgi:2-polyprenyl-3-methyl-5-hydroxy-6-metoxy-1,4-benzoquinol methylase
VRLIDGDGPWQIDDASFDVVWAGEVLEHVLDTAAWLSQARRVLRSGGSLLVSTPDHGRAALLGLALSKRAFAAHFDPLADHVRFYSRKTLTELIEQFGFEHVRTVRAGARLGSSRVLLAHAIRSRF